MRGDAGLVDLDALDAAIGEEDNTMRHGPDARVMGDHDRGGAKRVVDLLEHLEHLHAGLAVQRARGLVAEQYLGPFRDGPRDGDALLLAPRQLGRKMVHAVAQPDHLQRLLRGHRVGCDVGDKLHVLARAQRGHEVVELEDEAHVVAPVARQRPVAEVGQLQAAKPHAPRAGMVEPAENVQKGRLARARRAE
jgi:hypothetical protein